MSSPSNAALRRPTTSGFMAPFVVLEMVNAVRDVMGEENLDIALKEAQLFRLPAETEPVREDKAARLHQAVRKLWPEKGEQLATIAGKACAHCIIDTQITQKAKDLLAGMPRSTGAWLLAKTARQNAWMFIGSGEFVVESDKRFILRENPVVLGEDSPVEVCHFHASLLEELFSVLIHPRLTCNEVACHAHGSDECIFEFTMAA